MQRYEMGGAASPALPPMHGSPAAHAGHDPYSTPPRPTGPPPGRPPDVGETYSTPSDPVRLPPRRPSSAASKASVLSRTGSRGSMASQASFRLSEKKGKGVLSNQGLREMLSETLHNSVLSRNHGQLYVRPKLKAATTDVPRRKRQLLRQLSDAPDVGVDFQTGTIKNSMSRRRAMVMSREKALVREEEEDLAANETAWPPSRRPQSAGASYLPHVRAPVNYKELMQEQQSLMEQTAQKDGEYKNMLATYEQAQAVFDRMFAAILTTTATGSKKRRASRSGESGSEGPSTPAYLSETSQGGEGGGSKCSSVSIDETPTTLGNAAIPERPASAGRTRKLRRKRQEDDTAEGESSEDENPADPAAEVATPIPIRPATEDGESSDPPDSQAASSLGLSPIKLEGTMTPGTHSGVGEVEVDDLPDL